MALSSKDIQFAQSAISCAVQVGSMCPNVTDDSRPVHPSLAAEEKDALLKAMGNDGVVTSDELNSFGKFRNAAKMQEIGSYIGNTARTLYGAASRLTDAKSFIEWHDQQKSGWATLDYTPADERAEREGLGTLQQMERDGVDIFPAVRKMLHRGPSLSGSGAMACLSFSTISLSEATELATLVREQLSEAERSYGPHAQPVQDLKAVLAKLTSTPETTPAPEGWFAEVYEKILSSF